MKTSSFLSEILIEDNLDSEPKYIVTNTKNLSSRIISRGVYESVKFQGGEKCPPEIRQDLEKALILVSFSDGREEWNHWTGLREKGPEKEWSFDLGKGSLETEIAQVLVQCQKENKDILRLYWTGLDDQEKAGLFLSLSKGLLQEAHQRGIFCQSFVQTTEPEALPSFFEMHEKHFVTSVDVFLNLEVPAEKLQKISEKIKYEYRLGQFPLACRVLIGVRPQEMDRVSAFIRTLEKSGLSSLVELSLFPNGKAWSPEQKKEFALRELDWLVEIYQTGFPLPPLALVRPPGVTREEKNPCSSCLICPILPLCGGTKEEGPDATLPCPGLKYNFQEKILLNYALFGSKSVEV